jgi:hypothetical protein
MSFQRKLTAVVFASATVALPVLADIETTTVRSVPGGTETTTVRSAVVKTTTVTSNGAGFVLPSTGTYFVIDPLSGNVIGGYNPTTGLTDTSLVRPGLVVISKESGKVIAALDPSGRPIELTVAPAYDPFVISIDSRRTNIQAMISDCLSRGTIDAAEAAALNKEMNRISTEEAVYKQSDGILSYSEALQIALDLNGMEDRLKPFMPASAVSAAPLLGARMVTTNGQLVIVDDVEYRRVKLLQRVDDEYTAGRLSSQQVSNLKEQLNTVAALETKYRKNGEISESNKRKISAKLDAINTKMDQDVAVINAKRAKMGIKVN